MTTLFLIAHKVRGEPAFDIAERVVIGDEEGWIIPTSGHRAYPWWCLAIEGAFDQIWFNQDWVASVVYPIPPMPPDLPDHYSANDRPSTEPTGFRINLTALGLVKPKEPIKRRI